MRQDVWGRFYKGAFRLARQAGLPLAPVTFTASGPLLNKRIVKRADGRPVVLRMDVALPGAHRLEAGLEESGISEEMEALRAYFDRRYVAP